MKYGIGIDTGGTYTDAVLYDFTTQHIIATVKEPTTHHDVSIAVSAALKQLLSSAEVPAVEIELLAVSTTLATNAIVEKKGAQVGLIVIGAVKHFKLPVVANVFLKGGHTIIGQEDEPLDLEGLIDTLNQIKDQVDCYAVCAAMSMENPTHEQVAEKAVAMIDPKPVFCSYRLCEDAGMEARAATVSLHATLMPVMEHFLTGVHESMTEIGLECPMVIISGNSQAVGMDTALKKAAVTLASGPASAACFSAQHTDDTALVVDVGGTTTDVCMVGSGKPILAEQGCKIKEWQTHIETVDMSTHGIGGDSMVICTPSQSLDILETRVQPLAMTPKSVPPDTWLDCDPLSRYLVMASGRDDTGDEILEFLLANGPTTPLMLKGKSGKTGIALEKHLEWLAYKNRITMVSFTPTDALHVQGKLDIGNRDHSLQGAERLAALTGMSRKALCQKVLDMTAEKIEKCIIKYAARKTWGDAATAVASQPENELIAITFSLKIPIIAIGAAARYFLPSVARRLGTEVIYPDNYEVGSAIGAIITAGGQDKG